MTIFPVRSVLFPLLALNLFLISGCSQDGRQTKVYQAGEKATSGGLTYAVIDTQIHTRLGDDPQNPRIPQNRFYTVQIAVSSGNNTEVPIPGMTLVDDSGKSYPELGDGTGVQHWLGVLRKVAPAQTERGYVVFDAPAAHYKLKVSDDLDADDVFIDLPLNFVNEQMNSETATPMNPATPQPATKK